MSVVDADLVWYGSAVMPDDDTVLQIGGAIDLTKILVFTGQVSPPGTVEMLSSALGDVAETVTLTYLDASGAQQTETKTLNGTTPVAFVATIAEILKAVMSVAAAGIVTIRKSGAGATLITLSVGVTQARELFFQAFSNPKGGAAKSYFDKGFLKDTNGALGLNSAQIQKTAEPGTFIDFALEAALNGNDTNGGGNNRQVAPAGYVFDSSAKNVATGNLGSGQAQGAWFRLSLPAGQDPIDSTFTMRVVGQSA